MQHGSGPGPGETRNVMIAIVLSVAIMAGFEFFYNGPQRAQLEAERARIETQAPTPQASQAATPQAPASREEMLAASVGARIVIDTPQLDGSIALNGARLDDLNLKNHRRTVERDSEEVTLLSPFGSQFAHDAFFGWEMETGADVATLADDSSNWVAPDGARLTPDSPVTMTLVAGPDLIIERTISIDADFMFTITDVVHNNRDAAISVRPLGVVRRQGLPQDYRFNGIVHQGMIGAFGPDNTLRQVNFKAAEKHARDRVRGRVGADERIEEAQGQGGWFGLTDHYWLTAIVPAQDEQVSPYFNSRTGDSTTDFRAAYRGQWHAAPPGSSVSYTQHVFAGAKQADVLQRYQRDLSIPRFDDAVDWGMFWFLTRPFFLWLLHPLAQFAGNFGFGILLTTIVVKLLLFPLVYQSFKAMAKMRALQPKMKELQERYAADKQRQQQELLKLYQTEKINPVSGCIPILLQIPVFFALYKVLTNTIEMRHAPFVGWIQDLSAPDPTSIFNLFGLLPAIGFDFHAIPFLGLIPAIGVWAVLYGVSMWALQALSPPPTDPVQAQVFRFLPILFTFMFAAFPAGLVIYWTWSNTLSMLQQYVIMRRQGVETQLDKFIAKRLRPQAAE
jgi:YidC/Oxa1 family membrane protein insertase